MHYCSNKCINKHDYLLYSVSGENLRLSFVLISIQVDSDKNLLTIASKELISSVAARVVY